MPKKIIFVTKEAHKALSVGVGKWGAIADAIRTNKSFSADANQCALCRLYNPRIPISHGYREDAYIDPNTQVAACDPACPIKADTGRDYCDGTPYAAWEYYDGFRDLPFRLDEPGETLENAVAFRDYLLDLLSRCEVKE